MFGVILVFIIIISLVLFVIYMIHLLFIPIIIALAVLIFRRARKKDGPQVSMYLNGVENAEVRAVLKKGFDKQQTLKKLRVKISKRQIREKVNRIVDVVDRIFENLKKDPKDIKAARQFLNYYLDSTITILEKYVQLSMHGAAGSELKTTLEKTESMLDNIEHSFEVQLGKLLSNDVMDLDTEIKLLEKTFKMEGLDIKRPKETVEK